MNLSWHRIATLVRKEFLAVWRDKKSRFILIIPPLVQLFIFAWSATLDVKNISIGILNRDNGEWGFELVQRFRGSPYFTHITHLQSIEEIAPYINDQKGTIVLSIDEEFSRRLDAGEEVDVQLILDGRKSNTSQIVAGYAGTIIAQLSTHIARREAIYQQPIALAPRYWFNPNLLYYWFTVPGLIGILVIVETIMIAGLSIPRERELGTFDQLLVSPLTPREILIGKAIPAALIGLVEGSIMLWIAIYFFQIPFTGSFLLFYLSLIVFILSQVGTGLFFSAFCMTQQQAILAAFTLISPSTLLSGFATPIANMPEWMQYISSIIPLRYFLVISRGSFLKDLPASVIFDNLWPMAIIAAVTLTAATLLFRRKLE